MIKEKIKTLFIVFLIPLSAAWALDSEEIISRMDQNRVFKSMAYTGIMTIHSGDEIRVKTMTARVLHADERKAMVEFTNPEDRGTRYLMIGDNLWIYFPSERDVVRISGHMLKEGMMGSDLSYEDALETDELSEKYEVTLTGEEKIGERKCFVLELDAKVRNVPYFKRKMWVDKKNFVALKEEMYARSGRLLKEANVLEIKEIGGRTIPVKLDLINRLRKGSKTVFEMNDLSFDIPMDEEEFSMRYLRR